MVLKVLGSSSKGNCYILENNHEALIIEAGISFSKVRSAMSLHISKIVGCLISHEHGDHSKHIVKYAKSGISILASMRVFEAKPMYHYRKMGIVIEPGEEYVLGDFSVVPFNLDHDVPCLGFLISHPDSGRIAFITDTCSCDHVFGKLDHIIIECNYARDILDANIIAGKVRYSQGNRIRQTHMELENCKSTLLCNDISPVRNIVLVHLSNDNSDAERFRNEIHELTGINVVIATEMTEVDFGGLMPLNTKQPEDLQAPGQII
jgi:phosphoribosyl 1,2-cyclic phosphodiesterase